MKEVNKSFNDESWLKINYQKRFLRVVLGAFGMGGLFLIFLSIITFFYISKVVSTLPMALYAYYVYRLFIESRIFIIEIGKVNQLLMIKYYEGDYKLKEISLDKSSIRVDFFDSVKGNFSAARIVFYDKDVRLITQYQTGDWRRKLLMDVYERMSGNELDR